MQIAAGQSNAAKHGTPRARSGDGTFALAASGIYPLADPLPGSSGSGGSLWSRWSALACALVSFHAIEQPFLLMKVLFQRESL